MALWGRVTNPVHLISAPNQPGRKRMYIKEAKGLLSQNTYCAINNIAYPLSLISCVCAIQVLRLEPTVAPSTHSGWYQCIVTQGIHVIGNGISKLEVKSSFRPPRSRREAAAGRYHLRSFKQFGHETTYLCILWKSSFFQYIMSSLII